MKSECDDSTNLDMIKKIKKDKCDRYMKHILKCNRCSKTLYNYFIEDDAKKIKNVSVNKNLMDLCDLSELQPIFFTIIFILIIIYLIKCILFK
jgi:hypothetical protein